MAVNDRGLYHTNAGQVSALVQAQYDTNGDVVADGVAGEAAAVTSVDVLLLNFTNGKRSGVPVGTNPNEFEFTDTLTA